MDTNQARWRSTTILSVRKAGTVVVAGDGQVTLGQTIMKPNARKVRRLGKGDVIAGFAGAICQRWAVFEAGRASARDPKYTVGPQRERLASGA